MSLKRSRHFILADHISTASKSPFCMQRLHSCSGVFTSISCTARSFLKPAKICNAHLTTYFSFINYLAHELTVRSSDCKICHIVCYKYYENVGIFQKIVNCFSHLTLKHLHNLNSWKIRR